MTTVDLPEASRGRDTQSTGKRLPTRGNIAKERRKNHTEEWQDTKGNSRTSDNEERKNSQIGREDVKMAKTASGLAPKKRWR